MSSQHTDDLANDPTLPTPIASPPNDLLAPGARVGEWVITGRIGAGGMATVYAAMHRLIGKRAAVKVMSAELADDLTAAARFLSEARAMGAIRHPNVIDVFSFGHLTDGRPYFAMEWLEGESLADRIDRGPLPLGQVLEILLAVLDALEAAHRQGLVHRDVKPDNVMLARRGARTEVKLLDFGLAKQVDGSVPGLTAPHVVMGTPQYLSPEQARADPVDTRTDLYSFGVMAFEMATGRLPLFSPNVIDQMVRTLSEAPPAPSAFAPGLPPSFDKLVERLLQKDPARRPTVAETRARLEAVRFGLRLRRSTPAPVGERITRVAPPGGRAPLRAALVAAVAVALSAAALWPRPPSRPAAPTVAEAAPPPPIVVPPLRAKLDTVSISNPAPLFPVAAPPPAPTALPPPRRPAPSHRPAAPRAAAPERSLAAPDDFEVAELRVSAARAVLHRDYPQAIAAYRHAWQLGASPDLLLLLADAQRANHDDVQALHSYRAWLRLSPHDRERARAEGQIATIERELAGHATVGDH